MEWTRCFWEDCWLDDNPLREWSIGPLNIDEEGRKVRDFWKSQGSWEWGSIDIVLHHEMRNRLAAVVLLDRESTKDEDGWKLSDDNKLTVKSAYHLLNAENKETEQRVWEHL